ncbi:MAG: iron ABC transporter, partial [Planctomycetaceae bacterium]|nr:iron ABC transporter [Planctomycetaceae bacterium]
LFSKLPSGAMIVLVCSAFFFTSMIIGLRRGVLIRLYRRWSLNRTIDHQHLLRAMDELSHPQSRHLEDKDGVTFDQLLGKRSWSRRQLWRAISRAEHGEQLNVISQDRIVLTDRGRLEAARRAHQHRLWEVYLTAYADVGPARIDRECDEIEHVLEPEVVAELETLLATQQEGRT